MNRIFAIAIVFLVGCAQAPKTPIDVTLIPDDCANRTAITKWLSDLAQTPRSVSQTEQEYAHHQTAIKARIWRIRYNCQRVN